MTPQGSTTYDAAFTDTGSRLASSGSRADGARSAIEGCSQPDST
jgi:hypothetical protein